MLISNIQRFSLHDGPGIRTTVFMKGCSLRCPWCSNPENMEATPQAYIKDNVFGIYGKTYSQDEIFVEIMKDKLFYQDGGGVTFSGGEPFLQAEELLPLFLRLKEADVNIAVESALFVPNFFLLRLLDYIDVLYVDMKVIDADRCKRYLRGDIELYLSNLEILQAQKKKYFVRIPYINGYTDDDVNRKQIVELLVRYQKNIIGVEIIKEHNLGKSKYETLGYEVPQCVETEDAALQKYECEIKASIKDIPVSVCKI